MIVLQIADPTLRRAVARAARPDEDVFDIARVPEALESGFPRLLVREEGVAGVFGGRAVPVVQIDVVTLGRWERDRAALELPPPRVEYLAGRLAFALASDEGRPVWVDRLLADLARASGGRLPRPLQGFARRVLEFPTHYRTLDPVAEACGTTAGALKARFRRRGLPSPAVYLRWLRLLAVGEMLADPEITVAVAARRMGFTSDGNLCRTMANATGTAPSELRTATGRRRLLVNFVWNHLGPDELAGWAALTELFPARVA